MKKVLFSLLLLPLYAVLTASSVWAAMTVAPIPSELTDNQEIEVQVSLTGLTVNGGYYLRGDFVKEGSSNYFGQTWNGSTWGTSKEGALSVTTDASGAATVVLKTRPNVSDSGFTGSGIYQFKVGRYTASGTSPSWSDPMLVTINSTQPVSTPNPTESPTESPLPTTSFSPEPTGTKKTNTFTVSFNKTALKGEEETAGTITLSGLDPNRLYYLKGAFVKSGSTNYFGYTKVGSSFVKNGESYSKQFSLTSDAEGTWSGNLTFKPDQTDTGYSASGDYIFKLARYTDKGSGPTWSNELTVSLTRGTGTVVSADDSSTTTAPTTQASSKTLTQTSTSSRPTSTSSKSKVLGTSTQKEGSSSPSASVSGYLTSASDSANPVSLQVQNDTTSKKAANVRLLFTGLLVLVAGGFLALKKFRDTRALTQENGVQ